MAWETGTATDHDDLLDKLKTFLTTKAALVSANQQWVVLKDEIISSDRYVYFRGPGLADNDQIHVNIRRFLNVGAGAYNWEFKGATSYDGGLSYGDQPGTHDYSFLCLANVSMTYWFFANGRRFVVIAKIGTIYTSAYAGLIMPYALPSEYPYPLFIGATSYLYSSLYSDTLYTYGFWKGAYLSGSSAAVKLRTPNGFWLNLIATGTPVDDGRIWPGSESLSITKNVDGSYSLLPTIVYSGTWDTKDVFGELDGIFVVSGIDLFSEDTLTINGDVYLVFQSIENTGINDYVAILRE